MKLIDLDKVDFSAKDVVHPATAVVMQTLKESLYREPEVKAIPLEVIEGYLDGLLQEWDRLGDRKFDRANMQIYNHVRSMMDDLQKYCDREFKPTLDAQILDAEVKFLERQPDEMLMCQVTFLQTAHTYGSNLPEFDVCLEVKAKDHPENVEDFFLNPDERIAAYDKAAEIVGEYGLGDYVIGFVDVLSVEKRRDGMELFDF